jgi:C4-dicarboxylate transporter DctQ subunit
MRILGTLLDRLEEWLIALLLAVMTLITFIQVVLRYVFNTGWTWALEGTSFMFAWLIFLGMSYGVKKGSHIGVDAFVRLFPQAGQRVLGLVAAATCIAYTVIVLVGSWTYVSKMYTVGIEAQDIPVPMWVFLSVLLIGYALLLYRFLQVTWRIWTGRQTGLGLLDEAKEAMHQFQETEGHGPEPEGRR